MYPCGKFQLICRTSGFGTKFVQKMMNDKNFEKIHTKFEIKTNLPKNSLGGVLGETQPEHNLF